MVWDIIRSVKAKYRLETIHIKKGKQLLNQLSFNYHDDADKVWCASPKKTFITFFRKSTISESAAESDITVTPSLVQKTLNMMHWTPQSSILSTW